MNAGTANIIEMLSDRVETLCEKGEWQEAYHASQAVVDKARSAVAHQEGGSELALAGSLEIQADLLRQTGHLEDARYRYHEALEILNQLEGDHDQVLARISASVAVLYDSVENDVEAVRFYERAIELYERAGMGSSEEVADVCNNVGFIYRSIGNYDAAEDLFLKGLDICNHTLGLEHEKTATLCNNLGALYLKSEKAAQAREMNMMALEARLKVLGGAHPDTAQSHANLALSLCQGGEAEEANEHFKAAVKIYERNIKSESHEYAAVVENYAEFLKISDDEKSADSLIKKAQKKLSKLSA
ncbi:tetratricopeptide repeat protein [Rubritalea tangerina]|uniref:Tetratricopeptide repeat protein n=1 Tax=Rubritalea tangerina TaxID=430798 RepID=A0ABW4Z7Y1_9BACT